MTRNHSPVADCRAYKETPSELGKVSLQFSFAGAQPAIWRFSTSASLTVESAERATQHFATTKD